MDQFDILRREATKLERSLEDKIARYQQLAHRLTTGSDNDAFGGNHHHNSSLLDSAETGTISKSANKSSATISDEEEESTLANDINRNLSQLSDLINTRMAPVAERSNKAQHTMLVKRYREIVFDCTADFKKTFAAVSRRRETMELFRGADLMAHAKKDKEETDPATEQLLRERSAIGNAMKSATSVLGQAAEISSNLKHQGQSLRGIGTKVTVIAQNVPGLNTLIENIRRKRNKDDMIVSGVIAFCILFTMWYVLG